MVKVVPWLMKKPESYEIGKDKEKVNLAALLTLWKQ